LNNHVFPQWTTNLGGWQQYDRCLDNKVIGLIDEIGTELFNFNFNVIWNIDVKYILLFVVASNKKKSGNYCSVCLGIGIMVWSKAKCSFLFNLFDL
jgi:hypothetical protein